MPTRRPHERHALRPDGPADGAVGAAGVLLLAARRLRAAPRLPPLARPALDAPSGAAGTDRRLRGRAGVPGCAGVAVGVLGGVSNRTRSGYVRPTPRPTGAALADAAPRSVA